MQGLGELCFDIPGLRRLFETPESRNWVRLSRGVLQRTHSGGGLGAPSKAEDGYCLVKDTAPALFQVPRMKKREAKLCGSI